MAAVILAAAAQVVIGNFMKKDLFCSYCGEQLSSMAYPKECKYCPNITYINPLPVMVVLVPVGKGLLVVRRMNDPGKGELALPGGFLEVNETWQEGACREVFEETGAVIDPKDITGTWDVYTSPTTGCLIVFCVCSKVFSELPTFIPNSEVSEIKVITSAEEMAFPRHKVVAQMYFDYLEAP